MTIGATETISSCPGGGGKTIEHIGCIVGLDPLFSELGSVGDEVLIPSQTNGPKRTGLGLSWFVLEQSPASKKNGLEKIGPEGLLKLPI